MALTYGDLGKVIWEKIGELKESVIQYSDLVGTTYRTERDKAYERIMERKKKRKEKKSKKEDDEDDGGL